jgi:hypothetical protein
MYRKDFRKNIENGNQSNQATRNVLNGVQLVSCRELADVSQNPTTFSWGLLQKHHALGKSP